MSNNRILCTEIDDFIAKTSSLNKNIFTIIIDLDDTLVHVSNVKKLTDFMNGDEYLQLIPHTFIKIRPYATHLIKTIKKLKCNCIIWSAGQELYVDKVCSLLDPLNKYIDGIIAYGSWFEKYNGKDTSLLGFNNNKTLLIENTVKCVQYQQESSIIVPNWVGRNKETDKICYKLSLIIQRLVKSGKNVPDYLITNNNLQVKHEYTNVSNNRFDNQLILYYSL